MEGRRLEEDKSITSLVSLKSTPTGAETPPGNHNNLTVESTP